MAEFVLELQDLTEAGKSYDFAVRREWLAEALEGTGVDASAEAAEGRLTFVAQMQGNDVVIMGRVTSTLVTECARCLEDAVIAVDTDVSRLLIARGPELRPEPDEVELTPEDLDRDFYTGTQVVLDEAVRESLLVEVPIKPLCREECEGIEVPAAVSGPAMLENRNSPFASLQALVGKVPTEE